MNIQHHSPFMESPYLKQLQTLIPTLKEPLTAFVEQMIDNKILYSVKDGVCEGISLKAISDVGVQDAHLTKGTVFPMHFHETADEILIVYEGELKFLCEDGRKGIVKKGMLVRFEKKEAHTVEALTDVRLIGVTVPMDSGYPHESDKS